MIVTAWANRWAYTPPITRLPLFWVSVALTAAGRAAAALGAAPGAECSAEWGPESRSTSTPDGSGLMRRMFSPGGGVPPTGRTITRAMARTPTSALSSTPPSAPLPALPASMPELP